MTSLQLIEKAPGACSSQIPAPEPLTRVVRNRRQLVTSVFGGCLVRAASIRGGEAPPQSAIMGNIMLQVGRGGVHTVRVPRET